MFESIIGLGTIIGGAGRLGMSLMKFIFDYYNKPNLKQTEISQNVNSSCSNICNVNQSEIIYAIENAKATKNTKPLEKQQPKRFNFIIAIFSLAVIGIIFAIYTDYRFNNLSAFLNDTGRLYSNCWFMIEFIVSWVLTDQTSTIFKK